jgi:nucleoside-diphosphate-sugar epimerase
MAGRRKGMKVLIVGGTGLISTAITRYLLGRKADVTLYNWDDFPTEFDGKVKKVTGDRRRHAEFERTAAGLGGFDCVIDMICFLHQDAESDIRAFAGKTKQFIFCSTTDVYTKPAPAFPIREDTERKPLKEFPYAWEKAECERLFWEAHARGDFKLTVLRPSATYGEGRGLVDPFRSEPFYFDRIRKGLPLIVHGDGTSLWTSTHRDDVGTAFAGAAGNPVAYGKGYNAMGDHTVTWNQYWQQACEAMGCRTPPLVHIPTEVLLCTVPNRASWCGVNFQHNNIFVNDAAKRDLGFTVKVPFVDGVRRIVKWLDDNGRIPSADTAPWYDRIIAAWERHGAGMATELRDADGPFRP